MKQFKKSVLAAGIAAILPGLSLAATTGPTLGDVFKNSGVTINGYVDTSYTYLTGAGTFTGGAQDRVYDRERNSFNLHAIDLSVGYLPTSGFGAFTQLDFGSDANVSASAGSGASDEFDIQQAYVQYAAGPLTVIGGKFATLAGAEVITSPSNLNFTRSILFGYAIPFTHTGVRATYAIGDAYKVMLGVNNGWDVLRTSQASTSHTVDGKTLELGVSLNPIKPLTITVAGYYGEAVDTTGNSGGLREVLDVVATYNITDDLSVAFNFDMGDQKDALVVGQKAKWSGEAAYVNWKFAKQWRAAFRVESFDDKDGYRTGVAGGQVWKEGTATLAYLASDNAEIRLEGRYDKSDVKAFNMTDGTTKDNQSSVGIEAIYKF